MPRIRGGRFSASNDGWAFPIGAAAAAAAGVGIQNIQYGTATILNGTTFIDVTITAVDRAKTFVLATTTEVGANPGRSVTGQLTSTTNLRLSVEVGVAGDTICAYYVVELSGPVTVQYGYTSWASATTANATITAVDLAKTFVVSTWSANAGIAGLMPRVILTSTTNLQFVRTSTGGNTTYVAWFVVEFTG